MNADQCVLNLMGCQRRVRRARGSNLFGEVAYSVHNITTAGCVQEEKVGHSKKGFSRRKPPRGQHWRYGAGYAAGGLIQILGRFRWTLQSPVFPLDNGPNWIFDANGEVIPGPAGVR
jgi:hypothetical protein